MVLIASLINSYRAWRCPCSVRRWCC